MEAAVTVNWIAVIIAGAVRFAIGAAWYAPAVFGKKWQEADDIPGKPTEMPAALVVQAIAGLVMAYILARVIGHYGAENLIAGAFVGFMMWLGFVATISLPTVMFEKRKMSLFSIVAGYQLVCLAVMGAIIAVM